MTEYYIAPAGSGTSGNGLSRNNPIVGLTSINSNTLGLSSGDRLIFLPGIYYEQLTIPTSNLIVEAESEVTFSGLLNLSGNVCLNSTYLEATSGNWEQIDVTKNIWKKGCYSGAILLVNGEWLEPMPTSTLTNTLQYILDNLAINNWTVNNITTNGIAQTTYVRLPSGVTPLNATIEIGNQKKYNLGGTSSVATAAIVCSQKTNIEFRGLFNVIGVATSSGFGWIGSILIDRCTNVTNQNGMFNSKYCFYPLRIVSGDKVALQAKASYCWTSLGIEGGHPAQGTLYTGGDVEIYNWETNYCGWVPRYSLNGSIVHDTDCDGGVGIGYKGGSFNVVTVRDGVCNNGGPLDLTMKSGWTGSINRGSGIYYGTSDLLTINKVRILSNVIKNTTRFGIYLAGNITNNSIECLNNFVYNLRSFPISVNILNSAIRVRPTVASHPNIDITIANNTVTGGTVTANVIAAGNISGIGSNVKIYNNIVQNVGMETGYSVTNGNFTIMDNLTGTKLINNNIADVPLLGRYGQVFSTIASDFTAWQAASYDVNGYSGTVTINEDGVPIAGTANPFGIGVKFWGTSARPSDLNGEPIPDFGIDIGAVQSKSHPFHPSNLK